MSLADATPFFPFIVTVAVLVECYRHNSASAVDIFPFPSQDMTVTGL
jgi:hypothetical protein